MKTRIKIIMIPAILTIMFAGCVITEGEASDPNNPISQIINAIDASANAVKDVAPAAGPYGWIAGIAATLIASATGAYKINQKNATIKTDGNIITAQQKEYQLITTVTKSIIDAIESIGNVEVKNADGTVKTTVKNEVAFQLENNKIAEVGKAIITGLKAQKSSS